MTVNHILADLEFSSNFEIRQRALEVLAQRIAEAAVSAREALSPFLVAADPYQKAVIESPAHTVRLVAPAGAGKTQTIINRVLHRVRQGLAPDRTLLLTFDRAAVSSIRLKLRDKLAELGADLTGLQIQTLNAYGYAVLRDCFSAEYKPVVETRRQYGLVRELLQGLRSRSEERYAALPEYLAHRYYLEFFSLLKNNLFDPRAIDSQAATDFLLQAPQATPFFPFPDDRSFVTETIQAILWLYQGYERLLRRDRVLDFDDQKLRSYILLNRNPAVLDGLRAQLDEVIVDEFQDINRLDFVLIEAVARTSSLVVTGDDDQAIYGFRGCTPEYIIDLEEHLGRQVESHELQINYRCPPVIVEHADRLIRHNTWRIPKTPRAASDATAQIHVVSSLSAGLEAKSIAALIQHVRSTESAIRYKDFAVLYRTNAQSLPLQVEFILNEIPYYVRPQDSILQNENLAKLLSILRVKVALDKGTKPSVADATRAVCAFFRYIEPRAVNRVNAALLRSENFLDNIHSPQFHDLLPPKGRSLLPFAMQELLATRYLLDALDVVARRFYGVYGMIGSLEEVVEERVPLGEVYEIAASFHGDTEDFVRAFDAALARARATKAGQDHRGGVPLLTYFRSKGLQWHTVILTTCNEGLIPHHKAEVEEERRLFYVAMTRASSNLVLSYVKSVCDCSVPPSRFLYEAGLLKEPEKKRKTTRSKAIRTPTPDRAAASDAVPAGALVASVNSKMFHRPECGSARRIGKSSLVTYQTADEAINAGKAACSKCNPSTESKDSSD